MSERTATNHFGVDGQFVLDIKLSSDPNIKITRLHEFTLIEETGNLLPTWQIAFESSPKLAKEWVETMKLPVTLSSSMNSPEKLSTQLQIVHPYSCESPQGLRYYTASGVLYAPAFAQTPFITTAKSSNGTDVLKQVAKKHFINVDTEKMTPSQEKQIWIQPHVTDKTFLDYVASHCYLPQSFIGTGINSKGTYRIVDVGKQSHAKEDYTIGGKEGEGKNLQPLDTPTFVSLSGFMNSIAGYGMDTPIISQDGGMRSVHRPNVKFGFVENQHSQINNVQRRTLAPVKCSMSNDPNSYVGKANFDYGNALLSMERAQVTVAAPYFSVQIYDIVKLLRPESDTHGFDANQSGKYLVSKVGRTIKDNVLYTTLQLNRDAHNQTPSN